MHAYIHPAVEELKEENGGAEVYLLRDAAPQSHSAHQCLNTEAQYGIKTIAQPSDTPEGDVCDHSLWVAHQRHMNTHARDWEKAHPTLDWDESFEAFKARAKATALAMPAGEIDACMGHTKTNLRKLVEAEGGYMHG